MSHHIIEIHNLEYAYPDGTLALRGASFRITHGESVALIGANGAGKSTLLLHLNGCLTPTKGSVRIGDIPVMKSTLPTIRRTVGMVFQNPDDQLFMPTVYDDVAFGPLNLGLPVEEIEKRVKDALSLVGLAHIKEKSPYRLSAGQKRSVAIATVLSTSPNILVMDEPSSNLDPKSRRNLINLLKTFTHTKIIATHDLDMVLDLCERTIILHQGQIMADGATVELFQDVGLLEESHLEQPFRLAAIIAKEF
ncbi:cobalt ABC transporter ATPase subunit [Candidatus Vecturithrix granuli]|uniref:Cobalt ABC transporter ATPase subunit n=1 Tax=Vecturithrix granuli TaxID=1499967 RepID=A0A081BTN1_VECG1|nr:cobalt ABC transporter ATPase subunit [Candidatus Vecturithrix granuli]